LEYGLIYPKSLAISDEGNIYVCNNYNITLVDPDGKYLHRFGKIGETHKDYVSLPFNLAVTGTRVMVTNSHHLYEFQTNGTFIRELKLQYNRHQPFSIEGISLYQDKFAVYTCRNCIISGHIGGL
jgi:hypothetical protein